MLARQDDILAFDCDVTFGSSGAPVFRIDGSRIRIVSVVWAGHAREDGDRLTPSVPFFTDASSALAAELRADGDSGMSSAPGRAAWD
jgi:protease YdgD